MSNGLLFVLPIVFGMALASGVYFAMVQLNKRSGGFMFSKSQVTMIDSAHAAVETYDWVLEHAEQEHITDEQAAMLIKIQSELKEQIEKTRPELVSMALLSTTVEHAMVVLRIVAPSVKTPGSTV